MDSSVSLEDRIWFLRVCHHVPFSLYVGTRSIQLLSADPQSSTASSRLNWHPRRFKWTRPFRWMTKSGFCACAIAFRTCYNTIWRHGIEHPLPCVTLRLSGSIWRAQLIEQTFIYGKLVTARHHCQYKCTWHPAIQVTSILRPLTEKMIICSYLCRSSSLTRKVKTGAVL